MTAHGVLRKAVGSPSHQPRRLTASHDAPEFMRLEDLSTASREQTVSVGSLQDEHSNYESIDDAEPLTHTQHGSSTASGYTRVKGEDQAIFSSAYREGVDVSEGEQPEQVQQHQGLLYHLKAWWQEAACCLLAAGLFVGLVVLLNYYDGRESPRWVSNLPLNTVVAIIATMCRALTVIPISEGLSQLKWNSFARRERQLSDLYAFDQASRGPFGSLKLILKSRGRLLGVSTLAAVILISGLATSSLTQATISDVPPPEKTISGAIAKKAIDPLLDEPQRDVDLDDIMYATIMTGEKNRRKRIFQQLEPQCPAGDCHWNRFNSLAVCATTKNKTSQLEIRTADIDKSNKVLPEGYSSNSLLKDEQEDQAEFYEISLPPNDPDSATSPLSVYDGNWMYSGMPYLAIGQSPEYTGIGSSITKDGDTLRAYVARHDIIYKLQGQTEPGPKLDTYRGDKSPYRAIQVAWYWCIQSYDVNVSAGVPHTEIVGEHVDARETDSGELVLTDADQNEEFRFYTHETALIYLVWNWTDVMTAHNFLGTKMATGLSGNNLDGYYFPGWESTLLRKLSELGDDVALALTNYYRDNEEKDAGAERGRASIGNPVVVIRWPFLSLLAAQIVLTTMFLVHVIVDTARTGVEIVKSSNIAELLAIEKGKMDSKGESGEDLLTGGITAEVEKDLRGKLTKDASGWNLDIHHQGLSAESHPI